MTADQLLRSLSHHHVHDFQAGDSQQLATVGGGTRVAQIHRRLEAHHDQHGQRGKQPIDLGNEDLQAATCGSGHTR